MTIILVFSVNYITSIEGDIYYSTPFLQQNKNTWFKEFEFIDDKCKLYKMVHFKSATLARIPFYLFFIFYF